MPHTMIKVVFLPLSMVFASWSAITAWAGNGTILQSFPGASGPGYKPCPDTTGAVGPRHVVDFADSSFIVHDKATGKILAQMTMPEFWKSVEPKGAFVLVTPNDPRML